MTDLSERLKKVIELNKELLGVCMPYHGAEQENARLKPLLLALVKSFEMLTHVSDLLKYPEGSDIRQAFAAVVRELEKIEGT